MEIFHPSLLSVLISCLVISICVSFASTVLTEDEYTRSRDDLLAQGTKLFLGASNLLTDPREVKVNEILMTYKEKEYAEGLASHGRLFPAAQHFFKAKNAIDNSNVFKIIQILPKGGNLHTHHLEPCIDLDYVIDNLTKWDNLYYCVKEEDDHLLFQFSDKSISKGCSESSSWIKVSDLYQKASSEQVVKDWFRSSMSMITPTYQESAMDAKSIWTVFESKMSTLGSLLAYEEAYKAAYYKILLNYYNDNVMYIEIRSDISGVHRLNESVLSTKEILTILKEVTDKFLLDYPDFSGVKFIYSPHRFNSIEQIHGFLNESFELKKDFPDFFAGFDMVGQEDKGVNLIKFLPQLLEAAAGGMKYFFHSGETNWYGTSIDENLVDALLLNTTRLGHAFALYRHPVLYEIAKTRKIAVELSPISNQVLRHIDDLRIHPAVAYFRDGFPVVVASDDAGMWDAAPLSHDWYVAFMAIAGQRADLKFLKKLAQNSITYSAMDDLEKVTCTKKWELKWSEFLDKVIERFPPDEQNKPFS